MRCRGICAVLVCAASVAATPGWEVESAGGEAGRNEIVGGEFVHETLGPSLGARVPAPIRSGAPVDRGPALEAPPAAAATARALAPLREAREP